ncbi:general transcription factor IIH subunit 1-like [Argiope bruennichi]|uniref:general transcription factor IIH subunit 1-like n=1 Tax=Argiope bruennichi TaxID=94029 RepID=UPI0024941291|nr:general transcription factor IIH subunit 1-like [Argiope bruennichi]
MSPGTSSEDVLLMVNHVHHKKVDGTLYLMNERIAWMPNGKDTFSISHKYADIKMQKISPDGKSKVQLQVVLHSGDNTTFHFVNPMGSSWQLQDRNSVKELLQQLLPKFKRKINKELEEKNNILANDPVLFQLYRDLVTTQVITADEFWANYVKKPAQNQITNSEQETGVSGAFLIGIAPQTDGSCGIKYNITPEIIDSIFRTYPAVKRKHMENVPHKISESEFWTKFFQSHYFHRDRLNINSKDLFSECAKIDEQDVKSAIDQGIPDPFVDISSFEEEKLLDDDSKNIVNAHNTQKEINQNMIRRFNHHSMMVLQSCSKKKLESPADGQPNAKKPALNNHVNLHKDNSSTKSEKDPKKAIIESKTEYEDLTNSTKQNVSTLNLTKVSRYLSGPVPLMDTNDISPEEVAMAVNHLNHSIHNWIPNLPNVLSPSSAIVALGDVLPGGSLMKNMDGTHLKDSVPIEIQTEMKQLYCALTELLRHFWCCFPTTTPQLEEKVLSMQASLQRFEYAKLQPFQEKLVRNCLQPQLCDHMRSLLQAAYKKFSTWQSRLGR